MKKKTISLVIGILLVILSFNSVLTIFQALFGEGYSELTLNITTDQSEKTIQDSIISNLVIEKQDLNIEVEKEKIKIRVPLDKYDELSKVEEHLQDLFNVTLNSKNIITFEPINLSEVPIYLILVFLVYIFIFLTGITLILVFLKEVKRYLFQNKSD